MLTTLKNLGYRLAVRRQASLVGTERNPRTTLRGLVSVAVAPRSLCVTDIQERIINTYRSL
jgi:hypothetical protein